MPAHNNSARSCAQERYHCGHHRAVGKLCTYPYIWWKQPAIHARCDSITWNGSPAVRTSQARTHLTRTISCQQENEALAREFTRSDRSNSVSATAAAAAAAAAAQEEEAASRSSDRDSRTAVSRFMPTSRRIVQVPLPQLQCKTCCSPLHTLWILM